MGTKYMTATQDWLNLTGKVCVVTGAGSGIGASVASLLSMQNARVAMLDRDANALQQQADHLRGQGADVLPLCCDISLSDDVDNAAQKVLSYWERCDVLVNNAGLLRAGTLSNVSLEDWQYVLSVNLTGYLLCSRAFFEPMKKARHGSIVNIASISGLFPQSGSGAYSASKSAVVAYCESLRGECRPFGVRVTTIAPGYIDTPLTRRNRYHMPFLMSAESFADSANSCLL